MTLRRLYRVPLPEEGERVLLGPEDSHYLRDVLRLGPGDRVALFGAGAEERIAVLRAAAPGAPAELEVTESRAARSESPLRLVQAIPLLKGGGTDFAVEKATELGVREIVLFASARCVPRIAGGDAEAKLARRRRIAAEAARQSGRTAPPEVRGVLSFVEMLGALAAVPGPRILYWESAGGDAPPLPARVEAAAAATGPEGGFTPAEAEAARSRGFAILGLGPRILRADTAAVVAAALAQARWGDLSSSS